MRKKIINGLLLAVTFFAMSALVSCKDYESDYIAELQGQIDDANYLLSTLQSQQLAALKADVENLKKNSATKEELQAARDSLAKVTAELEEKLARIKSCECKPVDLQGIRDSIANLEQTKANLADMLAADALLQTAINNLAGDLAKLAAKEHQDSIDLATAIDKANTAALNAAALAQQAYDLANGKADTAVVNDLTKRVISLENRMTQVEKDAAEALAMAVRDSVRIDVLNDALNKALDRIKNNEDAIKQIKEDLEKAQKAIEKNAKDLADAKQKYDNALKVVNEALASLQEQINNLAKNALTMKDVQDYLTPIVNGLENKIKAVQDDLDEFKKLFDATTDAMKNKITSIELQATNSPVFGYFAVPVGMQSNILAAFYGEPAANGGSGDVYFPSDRNASYVFSNQVISDKAFEVLGGKGIVTKTTYDKYIMDESEGNAGTLYLTINPAEVDFSGITPILVNSRDKESGITLSPITPSNKVLTFGVSRAERVYNGFYEAKATLDPSKVEDVKPNFDINDLKPLAKQILKEKNIDLTNIYYTLQDELEDVLVRNGVKVEWSDTLGDHKVYSNYGIAATAIPALSFNFLADTEGPCITPIGALNIDVDLKLSYSSVGTIDYTVGDLYVTIDGKTYVVEGLDGLNGLIEKMDAAHADLSGDINKLIDQIKDQVEENVEKAEDKINNKVISKVNKVIKKINFYLQNPNNLLQPFLAYENEGAYHHMSMSAAIPTEFKFGTGNAIELIPTSYTAEILAPAFQKFVAVTNVIAPDFSASAQGGDATCLALAQYVNKEGNYMNTVIPGKQTGIVFAPDPAHKEGYIYEITYAAVDYNGYNVAKKFYVRVK
jgi:predicted  nucleic acid-binding Zn-ribbon protein